MITIPSLPEVYDIADTDVVMVTNNNGNTFKLSGAEVNRRNQVIIADSKTITGSPLKTGRIVRIYFTVTLTASNTTDPLILKYNNTNITVKIAKDGALSNYVAFSVNSTYKYLQAYTTLELLYNGTDFVVMGNPVVLSSNSYTIFANATIHKADVGLGSVVNTGDSATPVSGGTTKFTTGGAYTELAKKVNISAIGTAAAKTAGSAAGNVPLVGTALGTTDGNIVATNGSGALKPGGITVDNMRAVGTTVANCTTGASTAAKTATLSGFRLVNPSMIYVKIGTTNSASSPTLNVNSTGAKTIKLNGASVSSSNQLAAGTYLALYDGTYWNLLPYGIASSVTSGNMQSVSSDGVASALNDKIIEQTTDIGTFTISAGQTISPSIADKIHSYAGYSAIRIIWSYGQNYMQCSVNYVPTSQSSQETYAVLTNHYNGTLTSSFYLQEIFIKNNS